MNGGAAQSGTYRGENGVSEAVGFILIFSLVVTGIGLVALYGYPVLMKQQLGTDIRVMEKTMIVLQNDVKSLAYKNVPFKETSLKVNGGSLAVWNASATPQVFTVYVDGSQVLAGFHPGEIRYEADLGDSVISLENGAVISRNRNLPGSAMLATPRWFFDPETGIFMISLIRFTAESPMSQTGVGTIQMQVSATNYTEIMLMPGQGGSVEYTADPENDYSSGWQGYFTGILGFTPDAGGHGYALPAATTRIIVKEYTIKILNI
jgi:hypothetical protein